jgi:membrane associated rhomboid family serine protease
VTIGIAALTFFAYLLQRNVDLATEQTLELRRKHQIKEETLQLFDTFCTQTFSPTRCTEFAPLVGVMFRVTDPSAPKTARQKRSYERMKDAEALELAQANQLLEKFSAVKRDSPNFPLYEAVRVFLADYRSPNFYAEIPGAKQYASAWRGYEKDLRKIHRQGRWLSSINFDFGALAAAPFKHGSWLHLLSNLFVLVVFGMYVEARIGGMSLLLFYISGGTVALIVQLAMMSEPSSILLGASGHVSVVTGLFFVLFFQFSMRMFLPVKSFYAPVRYTVPLILLAADLSGAVGRLSDLYGGSDVAHIAHLAGFAWGACFGLFIRQFNPLPWPYLYPMEKRDMAVLQNAENNAARVALATRILASNAEHIEAKAITIRAILTEPPETFMTANPQSIFVRDHLASYIAVLLERSRFAELVQLNIPEYVPLDIYLPRLGQVNTLKYADLALAAGNVPLALRLYQSFLQRFPTVQQANFVRATVMTIQAPDTQETSLHA